MRICSSCQHQNPPQSHFCNNCGHELNDSYLKETPLRQAERRQLTILFCDLVGSTPLSEKLDPEEYREVITGYHQLAENVIRQHGGYVAQYLGDGLLVYFGYPKGLEDAPAASVRSGLGILKAVAQGNKRWEAAGKTRIKVRIGIHTGLVVVDDHLALGDTVNIAARLEGLAPHNGLVISPQTLRLVQGWFEVRSIGKHVLKGITKPMEVFEVLHETDVQTRIQVAKGRGLSPLVGRQEELEQLTKHWIRAKNGEGRLLLLNGEAGIGKSRLMDTLVAQLAKEPELLAFEARCSAYYSNSAFHPLIEMLQQIVLQFESNDDVGGKLLKLEEFVLQSRLDFKTAMPLMAEFLSLPSDAFPPLVMSPVAKRQKTMNTLSQALLNLATDRPLLLVLEDLHWADASTLEWLDLFMAEMLKSSIFVLCTTRPAFRPDWKGRPGVHLMNLRRLSSEEMKEICHHQTQGKVLPKEVLTQITDKTEGVPLFVEELTKMIVESEMLVEKEASYEVAQSVSSLTIPSTLQDSLLARLDRLTDVKEVVQVGAVLGREFSFEMLNAALPQKVDSMERSLSKLLDAEIFQQRGMNGDSVYKFKHALIQDTAYESLLKSRRQQLHHRVANVLEHQFEEISQNQPELLAFHYSEAAQPLQAIPHWLFAGQLASKKNATNEAIAHLEKGLDLLPYLKSAAERKNMELDFQLTLGGTFVVAYGFPHPKVKATFDKAREIAQTIEVSPKLALILMNLLSYYFNTEDYTTHQKLAEYNHKLTKNPENGYWFQLADNQLVGGVGIIRGDFQKSKQSSEKLLEIFNPDLPFPWELAPSGYIEIGAKAWRMICLQIMGYMDEAKSLSDQQLDFAKDHKDSMTLYHVFTFPSLYNLVAREWQNAQKGIDLYLPIVKEFGDPVFMLTSEVYYAIAQAFEGNKEAFEKAVQLVNVCFDIGFSAFAVTMCAWIGELYYQFEEYESGLAWVEKILAHVNKTGSHLQTAELYRVKGLILQAQGASNPVIEKNYLQALDIAKDQFAKTFELRAASALAKLWHSQGKTKEAHDLLKEVLDWFTQGLDSIDLQEAITLLSELDINKLE